MEPGVLLVLIIVGVLVIGVNGAIFLSFRRNSPYNRFHHLRKSINLGRKAVRRAQNPWETENNDLDELSRLVESLKESDK